MFVFSFIGVEAHAQVTNVSEANKGRIGVMTGSASGTYIKVGGDLSNVIDGKSGLRIVAMVGKGSVKNIEDLIYFRHTDSALVQSDVLELTRRNKPKGIEVERLAYIAKIYNEELHLVARKSSNIRDISDLQNKIVNVGGVGSGSAITSQLILSLLDIEVEKKQFSNTDAFNRLVDDKIDAMFFVQKKPSNMLLNTKKSNLIELIPIPLTEQMAIAYNSTTFEMDDYPNLVDGKGIETIAVSAILAVYDNFAKNGERYNNLEKFVYELKSNLNELKKRYPKRWGATDLNHTVPGWRRFIPMQNAINNIPIPVKPGLFQNGNGIPQ